MLPDDCSTRSMKLWVAINVFDQIIQLCKSIYIYIYIFFFFLFYFFFYSCAYKIHFHHKAILPLASFWKWQLLELGMSYKIFMQVRKRACLHFIFVNYDFQLTIHQSGKAITNGAWICNCSLEMHTKDDLCQRLLQHTGSVPWSLRFRALIRQ